MIQAIREVNRIRIFTVALIKVKVKLRIGNIWSCRHLPWV